MALEIYFKKPTTDFWEKHWQEQKIADSFKGVVNSPLWPIFLRYLPKKGRVLEAGCGLGLWVRFLNSQGYQVLGIDKAKRTIGRIKKLYPKLNIKDDDLLSLSLKKASFRAVICLGVLEHFQNEADFDLALKNLSKVLEKGGLLFCSVPYYNPLRRLKKALGGYPEQGDFYQYAYRPKEFVKKLNKQSFKSLKIIPFDSYNFVKKELLPSLAGRVYKKLQRVEPKTTLSLESKSSAKTASGKNSERAFKKLQYQFLKLVFEKPPLSWLLGHMLLFIAKKE